MHRLFDDGETRDELVVRRHHPLVRHAFGASIGAELTRNRA